MSPILVRPVREQLEHDRIIRLLQTKFRRRFVVGINPGFEQTTGVPGVSGPVYPDLVLSSQDRGRKPLAVVEVETVESVNNLEAMAEWVSFGKLRPAFHLYVPTSMVDVARRLCLDLNVPVTEIHTYHAVGDDLRFVQVYRAPADSRPKLIAPPQAKAARRPKPTKPAKPAARKTAARGSGKPVKRTQARSPKRK